MTKLMILVAAFTILAGSAEAQHSFKLTDKISVRTLPQGEAPMFATLDAGQEVQVGAVAQEGWLSVKWTSFRTGTSLGYARTTEIEAAGGPAVGTIQPLPTAESGSTTDPCTDQRYLDLKKRDLPDLSEREYEYFMQRDRACADYQNTLASVAPQERAAAQIEAASKKYWNWVIGTSFLSAIVYFAVMSGG